AQHPLGGVAPVSIIPAGRPLDCMSAWGWSAPLVIRLDSWYCVLAAMETVAEMRRLALFD
ncbi:MAG: hypothetical protein OXT71_17595, partial [Acidobacteriota bacterium]|nr:hypothetical protein [Acidobacteriota bacterium]